jgi:hypothetical protein
MKFDGSGWVYIGNPDFYSGVSWVIDFIFSPSGVPYVSFPDSTYSNRASVMKYDTCPSPVPGITGTGNLCINTGSYYYYTETGKNSYQWNISPGGTILNGEYNYIVEVEWNQSGDQWISVSYSDSIGCMSEQTIFPVEVDPLPDIAGVITGSDVICAGSDDIGYSVDPVANAMTYIWTLPAGAVIATGYGTNAITVNFSNTALSGIFEVYGNNLCGNGATSPPYYVMINPIPETPSITANGYTLTSSAPIGNQWYYNGILLVNDTNQIYTVSPYLPGDYWTQVTLSGCVSDTSNHIYVNTVGIQNETIPGFRIYPVPASESITIHVDDLPGTLYEIRIMDNKGNQIFVTRTAEKTHVIEIESYPEGLYFVQVRSDAGIITGKFIKK